MAEEKIEDVKEIKDVLKLVISGYKAYGAAMADGKLGWEDFGHLMPVFPNISAAVENISDIPAEFKDLDAEEARELADYVQAELDIDEQSRIGQIIDGALKIVAGGFQVYSAWKQKPEAEA